ncbi:MAG: hypothetical protein ACKVG2_02295 [Candidatus Poseidoniales archaeon]
MSGTFSRVNAVLLAVLLCASVLPQGAAAEEVPAEHFAFGVEYEWSNLNEDFESMTGLPLDEILADVMQSADDAGIEMLILEEITGSSSMIIDQYEDGNMMFAAADGSSVEVTKHVTDLTIRHGGIMDMAMITEWSDARAGWDLTISGGSEGIFNVDAHYIEYRDASGLIYGHDVEMALDTDQMVYVDLQGHLEAEDGDKVMPLDIHMEMGVGYGVTNAESSVVYSEPSTLYQEMSDLEGGEYLEWRVGEDDDDDYVWWDSMDSEQSYCSWETNYSAYVCEIDWDQDNNTDQHEYYGYCEYYADWEVYYCTDDFGYSDNFEGSLMLTHYQDDTMPERGISWQDYSAEETDCYWNGYDYECYTDYDGDGYNDDWNYWGYCEDYTVGYQCTDDFGYEDRYEDSMDWTHFADETSPLNQIEDDVESFTGTFSTATGFNFELTGLPAEEMGFPEGKWDVSVEDGVMDAGNFDEDFECGMEMELFEGTQMITTDGDQIEVMQAHTTPLPFGMTCQIGMLFYHAFMGSEDAATLEDLIMDSTEEIVESLDDGADDSWNEGEMMELSVYPYNQDEIEMNAYLWYLEENTTYEIIFVLEDSEGTTQGVESFVIVDEWDTWHSTEMSSDSWGEHCVTATLKDVTNSETLDTVVTCTNIAQEMEPGDLVMAIAEGFEDSTIENVMENFASNLEYRLEDYEADIAYDDGDAFVLWDTTNNMVVGFQMVVSTEDSNMWYTLVGPESNSYGVAPSPVSLTYFSGQQAIAQEVQMETDTTLEDLVDISQHNDELIEAAIEESLSDNSPEAGGPSETNSTGEADEEADGGLLPFLSPVLTISMIAVAGLVASLRTRKE